MSSHRPALKTHGGKHYLARRIIGWLPDHQVYVEPFAGGLSVLLAKPRCPVEVASDLNASLIGFYRVLQARPTEFLDHVATVKYDRDTFDRASQAGKADGDELSTAISFIIRNRFSRGGLGRDFAWSDRLRGCQPGDVNAWETIKVELPRLARRLAGVGLRCKDAVEVMREFDSPHTLFYLDPPYHPTTRTAPDVYDHEMSDADHARLFDAVRHCQGMVALSGYANPVYDYALRDWERIEFNMPNHSSQARAKQRRVEVLWLSPRCRECRFALQG
jgi:DNA adenine methylase